jgi:hypothetical protein
MKLKENLYAAPGEFFYDDGKEFEGYYHMFDLKVKQYFEGPIYRADTYALYGQSLKILDALIANMKALLGLR